MSGLAFLGRRQAEARAWRLGCSLFEQPVSGFANRIITDFKIPSALQPHTRRASPTLTAGSDASLVLERKRNIEDPARVNPAVPDAPNQIVLEPAGAGNDADAQSRLCKPGQTAAARTAMLQPIWPP